MVEPSLRIAVHSLLKLTSKISELRLIRHGV